MKKFLMSSLKIGLGIVIAVVLLGVLAVIIAPDNDGTIASDNDETTGSSMGTTLEPIQTIYSEPSEPHIHDDGPWIYTITADMEPVTTDVQNVGSAAESIMSGGDVKFIAAYSENLYESTKTAIENSNRYAVSPDLQPTKEKYNQAMYEYNLAAIYTYQAVSEYNEDNINECTDLLDDASTCLNSGSKHFIEASNLLEAYNKKNGY